MKKKLTRILSVYVLVLGLWFMSSPAPYVAHAEIAVAEQCCNVYDEDDNILLQCCGITSCSSNSVDGKCCYDGIEEGELVTTCLYVVDW